MCVFVLPFVSMYTCFVSVLSICVYLCLVIPHDLVLYCFVISHPFLAILCLLCCCCCCASLFGCLTCLSGSRVFLKLCWFVYLSLCSDFWSLSAKRWDISGWKTSDEIQYLVMHTSDEESRLTQSFPLQNIYSDQIVYSTLQQTNIKRHDKKDAGFII